MSEPYQPGADAMGTPASTAYGSVVVPAHNEAAVLPRLLDQLALAAAAGTLEVVVIPNGCTDDTAVVARRYPGVTVSELTTGSKIAALNHGDELATTFPRAYVDADVDLTAATLLAVFRVLEAPDGPPAARPRSRYSTDHSTGLARAYHRAKRAANSSDEAHLWGAGCYVLSRAGRGRFDRWPDVEGDDYWIDRQFAPAEKAVVDVPPVVVHPPRTLRDVIRTGARHYRGNVAVERDPTLVSTSGSGPGTARTLLRLTRSVRGPRTAADAAIYTVATVASRLGARRAAVRRSWERDSTSRRA